jgi:monoamine oxidase
LKRRGVVFEPSLTHKEEAIETLPFGNVAKLVFVFRESWWGDDFGFVHGLEEAIPTWWSDPRGPVLVGWAAGPKAETILARTSEELKQIGIKTIAKLFSRDEQKVAGALAGFGFHDWRGDADIGGAYSYIPVNGLDLPKILAAPVDDILFFAGEATAMDAQMGTVSGAIESGLRVVKEFSEV